MDRPDLLLEIDWHLRSLFTPLGGSWNDWGVRVQTTSELVERYIRRNLFGQFDVPLVNHFLEDIDRVLATLTPRELDVPRHASCAVAIVAVIYFNRVLSETGGCHRHDKSELFFGAFYIAWQMFYAGPYVAVEVWHNAFPFEDSLNLQNCVVTVNHYLDTHDEKRQVRFSEAIDLCRNLRVRAEHPDQQPYAYFTDMRLF